MKVVLCGRPSGFGGTKGLCILAGIFNRLEHR